MPQFSSGTGPSLSKLTVLGSFPAAKMTSRPSRGWKHKDELTYLSPGTVDK